MSEDLALLTAATSARDRFLATVLDTVASLVLVLDPEGRIVLFNRECERVSGYGAAEVLGRHVFDVVIAPEDAEKVKGVFRRLRAGESNAYDNVWVRKDGTRREIAWSNTILGDADGKVLYVVPTGVDVTERRAAERRAKESEEQLAQAAKLEAIGRLAGGVAHDFNNLLVVILAQAGALKEAVSPPLRADVEEIEQAGRQAAALTHQLLAFGRRRVVCHAPLDVNATISDALKMLRRLVGEEVSIVARLAPDLGPVFADAGGLLQVLMNLVVNARDAMPQGGTVTIESVEVEGGTPASDPALPDGRFVRVSVRDTGQGMSPEVQRHLFEPFFTTKAEGRGTGLGLATTFGIVKQARGHVAVESVAGAGACFHVYLPRHAGTVEAARPAPDGPRPRGDGRAVLLVEDDATVLRVAARALEEQGYRVQATQDPTDALRIVVARGPAPDVLVTDLVMPHMSGRELAECVRATSPSTRIVFMSGYAGGALELECGDRALLLPKPFDRATLLDTVARALAAR